MNSMNRAMRYLTTNVSRNSTALWRGVQRQPRLFTVGVLACLVRPTEFFLFPEKEVKKAMKSVENFSEKGSALVNKTTIFIDAIMPLANKTTIFIDAIMPLVNKTSELADFAKEKLRHLSLGTLNDNIEKLTNTIDTLKPYALLIAVALFSLALVFVVITGIKHRKACIRSICCKAYQAVDTEAGLDPA